MLLTYPKASSMNGRSWNVIYVQICFKDRRTVIKEQHVFGELRLEQNEQLIYMSKQPLRHLHYPFVNQYSWENKQTKKKLEKKLHFYVGMSRHGADDDQTQIILQMLMFLWGLMYCQTDLTREFKTILYNLKLHKLKVQHNYC